MDDQKKTTPWPNGVLSLKDTKTRNEVVPQRVTATDASAPGPTFHKRLAVWISIAEREARGTEGYKLYPCDWAALATLLWEAANQHDQ